MKTLRRYASLYRQFVNTSFAQAMSFRLHFVLVIVMDLLFYLASLASVSFIFDHVPRIGVWSRNEFLFFISFMLAVDNLHMAFISESFWEFSFAIRTGRLDFTLLKPVGSIFAVFFSHVRPASLSYIWVPWMCLGWYGSRANLPLGAWLFLPPLVLVAFALYVAIELLLSLSMFWTVEGYGINFLRIQLQSLGRWPDFIYLQFFRRIFTFFIPILLIGSAPVRFLFDMTLWQPLLGMIAALVILSVLIGVVWRIGLRRYESASS